MIRDYFRVLVVDLSVGKGKITTHEGRNEYVGGSGLAALLFNQYGHVNRPWNDPDQPLIFAIGPLTGYFPLMSKTVCAFKSPYHDQYAESHAGGRSALSLRFANLMESIKKQIQKKRWQLRLATGFKPEKVTIPKRFTELTTWKGNTDINYLNALKSAYAEKINDML